MAFKEGVVLGTVSLNATGSGTTAIGGTSNSGTITIGNTSSGAVSIGCGTAGISVGTTANAHSSTFGSTNSTSSTTVQSGSGALNVTSTNGALTINSGTGTLGISTDNSATTVNIGTGSGVKNVSFGSTNTTSGTSLKCGTGGFSIASGTGTIMSALSTGEITYPLQPAFLATLDGDLTNVTGDDTQYTVVFDNEIFDQNADFNGTTTFTAPRTGRYKFNAAILLSGLTGSNTNGFIKIVTTARSYTFYTGVGAINTGGLASLEVAAFANMTAADTASVIVDANGTAKVVDITGNTSAGYAANYFSGSLVC